MKNIKLSDKSIEVIRHALTMLHGCAMDFESELKDEVKVAFKEIDASKEKDSQ